MKRFISLILCLALTFTVFSAFTACNNNRDQILRIYNWGEYMDEEIFEEFEAWYESETGKKITVETEEFESNEEAYNKIVIDEEDFDLFCPSDYMIERMIKDDMLIEIDKDIIDVEDYIMPEFLDSVAVFDPSNKFSVPYMFGTMGIMYNADEIEPGSIDSWDSIFTDEYSGTTSTTKRIYMKNQIRDSFAIASIYANKDTLSQKSNGFTEYTQDYKDTLTGIFADASSTAIAKAKTALDNQHKYVYAYESDNGKFEMASGSSTAGHLGLFWSCDAGFVMNDYELADGESQEGNKRIWYTVPKEGSNVYFDAFVIPKFAKNVTAANYFLQFLCWKETAMANIEYVGSASPVEEAYNEYKSYLEDQDINEQDGFFNIAGETDEYKEAFKAMYIDMMFPSSDTLKRCSVMTDLGDKEPAVITMWNQVKG